MPGQWVRRQFGARILAPEEADRGESLPPRGLQVELASAAPSYGPTEAPSPSPTPPPAATLSGGGNFTIQLLQVGAPAPAYDEFMLAAKARWEAIIVGDVADVPALSYGES
ncbi:hypothetical protein JKP88DRAFT_281248 [Tribonema minus]|uniref:Uncharacterized protein n=1 Tax=Tribonema minus TaxID=303371 RepID=A0A835YVZ4_9STRA|nr:hypothetical protein JKP88DRAFT_281248 [Tribonema minus]